MNMDIRDVCHMTLVFDIEYWKGFHILKYVLNIMHWIKPKFESPIITVWGIMQDVHSTG